MIPCSQEMNLWTHTSQLRNEPIDSDTSHRRDEPMNNDTSQSRNDEPVDNDTSQSRYGAPTGNTYLPELGVSNITNSGCTLTQCDDVMSDSYLAVECRGDDPTDNGFSLSHNESNLQEYKCFMEQSNEIMNHDFILKARVHHPAKCDVTQVLIGVCHQHGTDRFCRNPNQLLPYSVKDILAGSITRYEYLKSGVSGYTCAAACRIVNRQFPQCEDHITLPIHQCHHISQSKFVGLEIYDLFRLLQDTSGRTECEDQTFHMREPNDESYLVSTSIDARRFHYIWPSMLPNHDKSLLALLADPAFPTIEKQYQVSLHLFKDAKALSGFRISGISASLASTEIYVAIYASYRACAHLSLCDMPAMREAIHVHCHQWDDKCKDEDISIVLLCMWIINSVTVNQLQLENPTQHQP